MSPNNVDLVILNLPAGENGPLLMSLPDSTVERITAERIAEVRADNLTLAA